MRTLATFNGVVLAIREDGDFIVTAMDGQGAALYCAGDLLGAVAGYARRAGLPWEVALAA